MRVGALSIALVLALAGCRGVHSPPTAADVVHSRADTADVLDAVWHAPIPASPAGVRWFYLPDADSTGFTASETVRQLLVRRGVPTSTRIPTGPDTVVSRVRRWTRDSTGNPILEFSSGWRRMSTSVPGVCMSGGSAQTYRMRRTRAGWKAEAVGPGFHGNGYCVPNSPRP